MYGAMFPPPPHIFSRMKTCFPPHGLIKVKVSVINHPLATTRNPQSSDSVANSMATDDEVIKN